jgi:hypothetical protein
MGSAIAGWVKPLRKPAKSVNAAGLRSGRERPLGAQPGCEDGLPDNVNSFFDF